MQFSYHQEAGNLNISVEHENYNYLIKARRAKITDEIHFRNFQDEMIYTYELIQISKKNALLELKKSELYPCKPTKYLHILWALIDPKTIEKELPALNQIGVSQITFVKCAYSQHNFKINYDRLQSILINSCMQCGRSDLMLFDEIDFTKLDSINDFAVIDFSQRKIDNTIFEYDTFLFGPEGGFSKEEKQWLNTKTTFGLNTNTILRSETAVSGFSAIYLLGY